MKSTKTLSMIVHICHVISQMFNLCIWIPKLIYVLLSIFYYTYSAKNLRQWTKIIFYEKNYEPPTTKYKQKINKRNKNKTIMQTLLLISSITQLKLAFNKNLSSNLNAFLNQDGILQINKLPNHLINDLKGLIEQAKFESMLPNDHIKTGIIDSGSSILCTPYEDDFIPGTFQPLLKQHQHSTFLPSA